MVGNIVVDMEVDKMVDKVAAMEVDKVDDVAADMLKPPIGLSVEVPRCWGLLFLSGLSSS